MCSATKKQHYKKLVFCQRPKSTKKDKKKKKKLGIVIPAFAATAGKTSVGKNFCRRFEQTLVKKISKTASTANAGEGRIAAVSTDAGESFCSDALANA
jgi:hypothetical protein